jgi:protocatechuate 3,4-dioxygenase beta subunit
MSRLLVLSFIPFIAGFSQSTPKGPVAISGRVLNEASGDPVPRALVEVQISDVGMQDLTQGRPVSPNPAPVFTDASGEFHLSDLPPGFMSISVSRPYFQHKVESIQLDTGSKSIQISLTKLGVVAGTVTDDEGKPLPGVDIVLYNASIVLGRRVVSQSRNVITDDLGQYRLWNLSPGTYFLKAAGRGRGTMLYSSEALPSFSAAESFVPVFFGGTTDMRTARSIDLRSESEATADFRLSLQPVRKIRGTVTGMTLFRNATFQLFDKQENVVASRAALSAAAGGFQILDVLPGSYTLRVTQGTGDAQVYGEAEVTVGDGDVDGLKIQLHAGVDITLKSNCKVPIPDQAEVEVPCGNLTLFHTGGQQMSRSRNKDVIFKNIPPGQYEFEVQMPGKYVTAVLVGGQVVQPGEKIRVYEGMGPVEIQTGDDGGTIAVKLEFQDRQQTADLRFLAVSGLESYAGPTNLLGGAEFLKHAPGDYAIYALHNSDLQQLEYHNPEALRGLTPSGTVRVEPNGHHTVTIRSLSK